MTTDIFNSDPRQAGTTMISPSKQIVEVHNLDSNPYFEKFRDEEIYIEAHGHVKMKRRKAVAFLGSYPPDISKGVRRVKRLQMRIPGQKTIAPVIPDYETDKFESHIDGKVFDTQAELEAHLSKYKDQVVKSTTSVKCPICDIELDNHDVFMSHLAIHRENKTKSEPNKKPVNPKGKK